MATRKLSERIWLRILMTLYFLFATGYSVLMPMWEAPDEPDHYLYALFVARERQLPPPDHNIEASQPPLYYAIASVPIMIMDSINPSLADYYRAELVRNPNDPRQFNWTPENYLFLPGPQILRWLGVMMGGLTVYIIYRAVRAFIPEKPSIALGTLALAALTPQFLHISASITNDVLANLAGAVLFWLAVNTLNQSRAIGYFALMMSLAFILTLLTKLNLLPVGLGIVVFSLWRTMGVWRNRATQILVVGVLVFTIIIGGLLLIFPAVASDIWDQITFRLFYVRPDFLEIGWDDLALFFAYSYWGNLGWLKVRLPGTFVIALTGLAANGLLFNFVSLLPWDSTRTVRQNILLSSSLLLIPIAIAQVNLSIGLLLGLSAVGRLFYLRKGIELERFGPRAGWILIWLILGFSVLALGKNVMATPQYQGRFLFPAIGVIALGTVAGWHTLLTERFARALLPFLILLMTLANLILWFGSVLPDFYQPFLD